MVLSAEPLMRKRDWAVWQTVARAEQNLMSTVEVETLEGERRRQGHESRELDECKEDTSRT